MDTPIAPWVRKMIENPAGRFAVVMIAVTLLCVIMAALLGWTARRRTGGDE